MTVKELKQNIENLEDDVRILISDDSENIFKNFDVYKGAENGRYVEGSKCTLIILQAYNKNKLNKEQ